MVKLADRGAGGARHRRAAAGQAAAVREDRRPLPGRALPHPGHREGRADPRLQRHAWASRRACASRIAWHVALRGDGQAAREKACRRGRVSRSPGHLRGRARRAAAAVAAARPSTAARRAAALDRDARLGRARLRVQRRRGARAGAGGLRSGRRCSGRGCSSSPCCCSGRSSRRVSRGDRRPGGARPGRPPPVVRSRGLGHAGGRRWPRGGGGAGLDAADRRPLRRSARCSRWRWSPASPATRRPTSSAGLASGVPLVRRLRARAARRRRHPAAARAAAFFVASPAVAAVRDRRRRHRRRGGAAAPRAWRRGAAGGEGPMTERRGRRAPAFELGRALALRAARGRDRRCRSGARERRPAAGGSSPAGRAPPQRRAWSSRRRCSLRAPVFLFQGWPPRLLPTSPPSHARRRGRLPPPPGHDLPGAAGLRRRADARRPGLRTGGDGADLRRRLRRGPRRPDRAGRGRRASTWWPPRSPRRRWPAALQRAPRRSGPQQPSPS